MNFELIDTLLRLKEKKVALAALHALGKHAQRYEEFAAVAQYMYEKKLGKEAVPYTEKVVELSEDKELLVANLYNLLGTYLQANLPEKALVVCDRLNSLGHNDPEIRLKRSLAHFFLNQKDISEQLLRNELKSDDLNERQKNEVMFNLAIYEIYRGNLLKGLHQFLHFGRLVALWPVIPLPFNEWDGTPHPGKILVVQADAGIGDEFVSARFVQYVKEADMEVYWLSDRKDVREVLTRHHIRCIDSIEPLKKLRARDLYWCRSMWLPVLMKLEPASLWYGPYLTADRYRIVPEVLSTTKLKVGIRWQGNPEYDHDLHRTLPLDGLVKAIDGEDTCLVSLQRDEEVEDLVNYPNVYPTHHNDLDTLEDTLAIIDKLDLVATSCTSIAHLAAAMGKRTVVLVPISAYYVWGSGGTSTPWYGDHVTVLRQEEARCWQKPLIELSRIVEQERDRRKFNQNDK